MRFLGLKDFASTRRTKRCITGQSNVSSRKFSIWVISSNFIKKMFTMFWQFSRMKEMLELSWGRAFCASSSRARISPDLHRSASSRTGLQVWTLSDHRTQNMNKSVNWSRHTVICARRKRKSKGAATWWLPPVHAPHSGPRTPRRLGPFMTFRNSPPVETRPEKLKALCPQIWLASDIRRLHVCRGLPSEKKETCHELKQK